MKNLGFNIVEKIENEKIISKIITSEELDKKIVAKIKEGNVEEAYKEIEIWYSYIKERLEKEQTEGKDIFEKYKIEVPNEIKEKMQFVKSGYIDLSFENIFCENGDYLFYDQEWYFENIPLEFILYRAINNLYTYNSSKLEQKVKKEDIFIKFNLYHFVPYFEQIEKQIQKEILDENIVDEYRKKIGKYYKNLEELQQQEQEKEQINKQFTTLKEQSEILKKEKEQIESKYNQLLNEYNTSRGWKLIKGFRSFFRKG